MKDKERLIYLSVIAGLIAIIPASYVIAHPQSECFPPSDSAYSTEDELLYERDVAWLGRILIPQFTAGWMLDIQNFGAGPQIESVALFNETTVRIRGHNGSVDIYSQPERGYRVIYTYANFTNTNFMPAVRANQIMIIRETTPPISFNQSHNPSFVGNRSVWVSYGEATLYYGGNVYYGQGTYEKNIMDRAFDPSGGFFAQVGWISDPDFILRHDLVSVVQNSTITWLDTGVNESVYLDVYSEGCGLFTYTFDTSRGLQTIHYNVAKYVIGIGCSGESIGNSDSGYGWAFIQR